MATREQIQKLFKQSPFIFSKDIDRAADGTRTDGTELKANTLSLNSFGSIAQSAVTSEQAFFPTIDGQETNVPENLRLNLSTTDVQEFLKNSTVKGCVDNLEEALDITRIFSVYYSVLWTTLGRKNYDDRDISEPIGVFGNILNYGASLYDKGRDFWSNTDKLSAEFGSRWIKQREYNRREKVGDVFKDQKGIYTGFIMPVHRAADRTNDDQFGCENEEGIGYVSDYTLAAVDGWRVNRTFTERKQYSGACHMPTWLNYQMATTNPNKTVYGPGLNGVRVKDDFFLYNSDLIIQAHREESMEGAGGPEYYSLLSTKKARNSSGHKRWSFEAEKRYSRRSKGSAANPYHWQYYSDWLPYWNLVSPWTKEEKGGVGMKWYTTKNFYPNTADYDHFKAPWSNFKDYKPEKDSFADGNRVLSLRHGSLQGGDMPDEIYKNPTAVGKDVTQKGLLNEGLFMPGNKLNTVLRSIDETYGWKDETKNIPFDLVLDYFNIREPTYSSTKALCSIKTYSRTKVDAANEKTRLVQNYFGLQREARPGGWDENGYGLGFALEPLKFVELDRKFKGTLPGTGPEKYQTAFYIFSWAFNILSHVIRDDNIPCVLKFEDFAFYDTLKTMHPMKEDENRKQHAMYEFLLNYVFELLYMMKNKVDKIIPDELPQPKDESVLIGKGDNFNEAAKSQIIENAQCYMLNTIDKFASSHTTFSKGFNLNYDSILITQAKRGKGNPSYGGVKCDHFLNLLGKRDDVLNKLLNIKPAELALLQPRIRLYKQRKVINPKTGKEDFKPSRINVPGPFQTHIDSESIKSILAQRQGRMLGAGITEINIRSEGGNKAFDVNSLIETEIKFHFNRLEEIFLNWPVYPKKSDGTVEYDKPDYPFGITPGYTKDDAPASIAELVFPPAMNPDDISLGKFTDYNKPDFQIMLEVGWSVPQTFESNINKNTVEAQFVEKMKEKTLYKTFFLSPLDSEFNINENGTIELTVGYIAIPDTLLESTKNKLFPSLHLDTFDADVNRQVTKKREKIQKLRESEGKSTINSLEVQDKINVLKKEIKKIIESAQDDKLANFLNQKISRFFGLMMGLKRGDHRGDTGIVPEQDPNRQIYHRISLPYTVLGIYKDLKKVRRWKPYRELGNLSNINLGRKNVPNKGRAFDSKGIQTSTNVLKDAAQVANAAASNLANTRRALQNNDKNEAIKFKQLANKQFQNLGVDSLVVGEKNRDSVDIDFLYFGDIVQTVIDYAIMDGKSVDFDLFAKPTGMREDFVNIIFGCLSVPLVGKDGNTRTVSIKITDIPIVANIFVDFTVNYLVKPEKYDISYLEFIVSFYRWFIKTYFSTKCFLGVREITSMHPEVNFFSMYGLDKKGKSIYFHPLTSFERSAGAESLKFRGLAYSPRQFADIMDDYDKKIRTGQYQKDASFHFCYLGGQTIGEGNYDYKDDLKKNIYHFYIGKDSGIVKNIQFKASDLEGRAEAAWSVMGDGLNNAMFMIPRVYDVTVTLIGNHLFEPGQTFFVNPTMGTNLSIGKDNRLSSSDILKNTGLGGYYYIINMETRVKEGLFETVIEGVKIGLASSSATSQSIDSITAEDTTRASIDEMKEQMEKQKKRTGETRGPLDELKDWWRDISS